MKIKLVLICVCLLSCIFLISGVSASDVNGTVAVENDSQIEIINGNVEFDDAISQDSAAQCIVSDDNVAPYQESSLQSNVKDPVLMDQTVGSVNNGARSLSHDMSNTRQPSSNVITVRPSVSVDTYNVLDDNKTTKTVKFTVTSSEPMSDKKVSLEAYQGNNLFVEKSIKGKSIFLDLPAGYYKIIFKSEYPNLSREVFTISVTDGKSFYDLNRIINGGKSKVVLDRDYTYNPTLDKAFKNGLVISKPVTINGNGHTIDAKNKIRIFDVVSNDVTIANITLKNGHVVDCGGALLWQANNGVISNVSFINDTSEHVGGAIALDGANIILDSPQFKNSTAGWTNDLIYLGHNFKNATLQSCNRDDLSRIIDGRKVNLTLTGSAIPMKVLGCNVDMSKYIFDILAHGGERSFEVNTTTKSPNGETITKTRTIYYYGQLINGTTFMITFYENPDGLCIMQDFIFTGASNASGLIGDMALDKLRNGDFNVTFTYLKYAKVQDKNDYEDAVSLKAKKVFGDQLDYYSQASKEFGKDHVSCIKGLGVNFEKTLLIKSHSKWSPKKMGFDAIFINGNNSVIEGGAKKRDSYKWADVDEGYVLSATNITIKKFNNAFVNDGGICILSNSTITQNKMKYIIDRDWGAGLLNAGWSICSDCVFTDNYCCCGGAIFNQGVLTLNNCTFKGNDAYRKGNTVLNVDDAEVYLDGVQINGSSGPIKHVNSISSGKEKLLQSIAVIISFGFGAVGGACTSPLGGAAIGAGVGAVVGGLTSIYLNANHYDIHYNRLKATLILTGVCALSGAIGGVIGGYAAQYTASADLYGGMIQDEFEIEAGFEYQLNEAASGGYGGNIWGESYKTIINELPEIIDGFIA